jgi:hypothetical protein
MCISGCEGEYMCVHIRVYVDVCVCMLLVIQTLDYYNSKSCSQRVPFNS